MSSDPLNRRLEVICSRQRRSARRRAAVKRRSGGFSIFDQPVQNSASTGGRSRPVTAGRLPRISPPRRLQLAAVGASAAILAMTALAIESQRPAPPPFLLADKLTEDGPSTAEADSQPPASTSPPASLATARQNAVPQATQRFAARPQVGIQADHSPYSGLDFAEEPPVTARPVPSGTGPRAAALPAPVPHRSQGAEGLRRRLLQPHPADFRSTAPFTQDGYPESVPATTPADDNSEIGESSRWPRRDAEPPQVEVSPVVPAPQSLQIPQLPPADGSENEPPRPAPQQPATGNAPPADSPQSPGSRSPGPAGTQQSSDATGVQFPTLPALPPVAPMAPGSNSPGSNSPGHATAATPAVPHAGHQPAADAGRHRGTDRAEQISVHSRTAAQDRLRRLALTRLQAARDALKRGELQSARSIALDTQQLKVLYGLFDDRPDLVLQDIEQLEQQFATPPAAASSPGGPSVPARSAETPAGPRPARQQNTPPAPVPEGAASPQQLRELQQLQRESLGTLIQSPVEPAAPASVPVGPHVAPRGSATPALVHPPLKPIEPPMVPERLPGDQDASSTSDSLDAAESADSRVDSAGWRRTDLTFQFDQVPWSTVLRQLSDVTGLELEMPVAPPGTLTYHNPRTYAPREVIRILNLMLAERGFQLYRRGNRLVVRSLDGNTAN